MVAVLPALLVTVYRICGLYGGGGGGGCFAALPLVAAPSAVVNIAAIAAVPNFVFMGFFLLVLTGVLMETCAQIAAWFMMVTDGVSTPEPQKPAAFSRP